MSPPSSKRTFKRPRRIKTKSFFKVFKVKEIRSDIEFSHFLEQLLEKKEKFISTSVHKVKKGETKETWTKPIPDNFKSTNSEPQSIKDNTPHHLIPIIESLSIYSGSEPEGNSNNPVSNNDQTWNIEIITISSDSGSETETKEPIFVTNKNFSPRIIHICSLGKNKVKLIKNF